MENKYRITIQTEYGSLTVDDIIAENEKKAIEKAEKLACDEIINYSKIGEVHCYNN